MKKILAKFIFYRVMGWRIVGRIPTDVPQAIVAVGPHTSSWDFLIGVLSRNVLEQDISFIGKDSLFKGPFGWLFRWLGGYPVDRSRSQGMVEAVVQLFRTHPRFYLSLSPEGTRKKADRLRSGFYHMAVVPVCRSSWWGWTSNTRNCVSKRRCIQQVRWRRICASYSSFFLL